MHEKKYSPAQALVFLALGAACFLWASRHPVLGVRVGLYVAAAGLTLLGLGMLLGWLKQRKQ